MPSRLSIRKRWEAWAIASASTAIRSWRVAIAAASTAFCFSWVARTACQVLNAAAAASTRRNAEAVASGPRYRRASLPSR